MMYYAKVGAIALVAVAIAARVTALRTLVFNQ